MVVRKTKELLNVCSNASPYSSVAKKSVDKKLEALTLFKYR